MTQAEKCNKAMKMGECTALPELSMLFYTNFSILAVSVYFGSLQNAQNTKGRVGCELRTAGLFFIQRQESFLARMPRG